MTDRSRPASTPSPRVRTAARRLGRPTRVNLWGRLAQVAEDYVSKGDKLFVEGYLQYDSYERDGVTIPTAEVRAREMIMLTPRGNGG